MGNHATFQKAETKIVPLVCDWKSQESKQIWLLHDLMMLSFY